MKADIIDEKIREKYKLLISKNLSVIVFIPFLVTIGLFLPHILYKLAPYLVTFSQSSFIVWGGGVGTIVMALVVILRKDEIAAIIVIAVRILLDWYLHTFVLGLLAALVLLLIFFLGKSEHYPWAEPRALWLWMVFLVLVLLAGIRGILTAYEIFSYYNNFTLGAFIMFCLGTTIGRSVSNVHHFFKLLAAFGTLIAIHAIIQAITGVFLFWSPSNDSYYASLSNFVLLPGLDVHRIGSFLLNPDWSGPFFAVILFIALGLFFASKNMLEKLICFTEFCLSLIALIYTYTYGAIIGACAGLVVIVIFIGNSRHRIQILLMLTLLGLVITVFLASQLNLLQQRFAPADASVRVGAWQTAIRIIEVYPLTGIGLGLNNYEMRAEAYRVPAQYMPLDHPLNSYLELAAEGGIPVAFVFVVLLALALWFTLINWLRADRQTRALLGGCIAGIAVLSIDSLTNNIWTNPPLAALGWLILGVTSSRLLSQSIK